MGSRKGDGSIRVPDLSTYVPGTADGTTVDARSRQDRSSGVVDVQKARTTGRSPPSLTDGLLLFRWCQRGLDLILQIREPADVLGDNGHLRH